MAGPPVLFNLSGKWRIGHGFPNGSMAPPLSDPRAPFALARPHDFRRHHTALARAGHGLEPKAFRGRRGELGSRCKIRFSCVVGRGMLSRVPLLLLAHMQNVIKIVHSQHMCQVKHYFSLTNHRITYLLDGEHTVEELDGRKCSVVAEVLDGGDGPRNVT